MNADQISGAQRLVVIPFFATVPFNATRVYRSLRISSPFLTREFSVSFALNTNRTLRVSFYISPDEQTLPFAPSGFSVFSTLGQVDYVTGDDERKVLRHESFISESGMFLKVLASNTDGVPHTLDSQITIELFPRGI